MWYMFSMEYELAGMKSEIRKFSGKEIDLEKLILSEIISTQKDKPMCSLSSMVPGSETLVKSISEGAIQKPGEHNGKIERRHGRGE